jgi:hypothetical protein
MLGKKKGDIDADIVFTVIEKSAQDTISGKNVLVSRDADY